jgi:hypothetical protein
LTLGTMAFCIYVAWTFPAGDDVAVVMLSGLPFIGSALTMWGLRHRNKACGLWAVCVLLTWPLVLGIAYFD